jgi:hypothetical protein
LIARYPLQTNKLAARIDLTGDGIGDYVIEAQCPASTSSWPLEIFIVDGASSPSSPRLIGTDVQGTDYFRTMDLSWSGKGAKTKLTMSGQIIGDSDPLCCPGHTSTVTIQWSHSKFKRLSRSEHPL